MKQACLLNSASIRDLSLVVPWENRGSVLGCTPE